LTSRLAQVLHLDISGVTSPSSWLVALVGHIYLPHQTLNSMRRGPGLSWSLCVSFPQAMSLMGQDPEDPSEK
jgi:hypothetical protein